MTPEQRFDRLERIVKLLIKAGLRARKQSRDEKIGIIVDAQMRNEQRFAELAAAEAYPNRRLDALIYIVRSELNGKSAA
jgi:hypothetical protein